MRNSVMTKTFPATRKSRKPAEKHRKWKKKRSSVAEEPHGSVEITEVDVIRVGRSPAPARAAKAKPKAKKKAKPAKRKAAPKKKAPARKKKAKAKNPQRKKAAAGDDSHRTRVMPPRCAAHRRGTRAYEGCSVRSIPAMLARRGNCTCRASVGFATLRHEAPRHSPAENPPGRLCLLPSPAAR